MAASKKCNTMCDKRARGFILFVDLKEKLKWNCSMLTSPGLISVGAAEPAGGRETHIQKIYAKSLCLHQWRTLCAVCTNNTSYCVCVHSKEYFSFYTFLLLLLFVLLCELRFRQKQLLSFSVWNMFW